MIAGAVNADGEPLVMLLVNGQDWPGVIDTGFNGDLELPLALQPLVNARYQGTAMSDPAGGQTIFEDAFRVDFPFDGQLIEAEATFAPTPTILIGTHLLRNYRLEIHFVLRTVLLERVA